ncbi:MAG: hypothetical protein IPJ50_01050 [Betaproteobacteria bacterium]|nr:hypothetical protein [Betaproteobacteria bacterium]
MLEFYKRKARLLAFDEQPRHCGGKRLSFMFATVLAAIARREFLIALAGLSLAPKNDAQNPFRC